MERVADYIMRRIVAEGVGDIFYVPGGQCVYLTDAVRRNQQLNGIAMHHEQSAAMAALSYALYNNNYGACLVTTGCAGTNTMTGVLHAWQDSIPCIFISGQQNYHQTIAASGLPLRQVGVQEADIASIMQPITKYAVTVSNAEEIVYHMDKAIHLSKHGRKGPVWIDVPLDIQNTMIDPEKLCRFEIKEEERNIDAAGIDIILKELETAERPIILAGNGIRSANAVEELRKFIDIFKIPAVTTRFSRDLFEYEYEYNLGVVSGLAGASRYANFSIQNADLIISIGSRLSLDTTGSDIEKFARAAKIIVVDIDEIEHSKKGVKIEHFLHMDAKEFLNEMLRKSSVKDYSAWIEKCRHWKQIFPLYEPEEETKEKIDVKYFIEKMSQKMPENSVVISDAGFTGASTPAAVQLRRGQRMLHSFAQGEMGYSLPGACGVAAICKDFVIAVSGDGSFMMNLQELQTVVRNQFNIKTVIINNNGYSGVRHGQKAHFRGKSIGTDPSNGVDFPEYRKIAEAFGINYYRICIHEDIMPILEEMFSDEKPCICETYCDPEQFDLHNAIVMYGKRKIGFRPIEDQSPFVDRDVFFKEMIVEPMEESYGKPI